MSKMFCDKCGKEITDMHWSVKCDTSLTLTTVCDLCLDCWIDLRNILIDFLQKPVDSTEKK